MSITLLGWILLPVGLVLALLPSRTPLLVALVFFVPFTASALINLAGPGFGVQPGYYLGALWMARLVVDRIMAGGRLPATRGQRRLLAGLALFALAAVASVTLIVWYGSNVLVYQPSGGEAFLGFSSQNLTQLVYVVYVVAFAGSLVVADLSPDEVRLAVRTLIGSGLFVAGWGWMQLALFRLHLPYPDTLFNNSASFLQHFGQTIEGGGIKRMTSVAPEPSMLARFLLIPAFLSFYAVYEGTGAFLGTRAAVVLAVFFSITLMATTSSTALVGLVGGAFVLTGLMMLDYGKSGGAGTRARRVIGLLALLALALPLAAFLVAHWWLGLSASQTVQVLNILVFSKLSGTSGTERLAGALHGLQLFATHPLLGVGWGSDRTYDLLTNLLATTGLIGTGLFLWVHVVAVRSGWRVASIRRPPALRRLAPIPAALILALLVAFLGKAAAEPDLVYLDYWTVLGLLGATLAWPSLAAGEAPAQGDGADGVGPAATAPAAPAAPGARPGTGT